MRALVCCDAVGGVYTYAEELCAGLAQEGVETLRVALGPEPPPDPTVPYLRCRLEWQEDPWSDVESSARWLRDMASQAGADVVHLGGYAHAAAEWRVPVVVVGHSCLLSWHEAVRGGEPPRSWLAYRERVAAGIESADAFVAPTRAMRRALRRHYGLRRRGAVIANGVAAGPPPRPRRDPVVLAAGRVWDEAKGLGALASAAAGLSWPVLVAGEGSLPAGAGARALGPLPREQLRELMARAAVFAHPARYEPFGLAPLEAALGGCALVLGDIPTLRELWDGAATFVTPGDSAALHDALRGLIADDRRRRLLAGLARMRAMRYGARRSARAYAALYERLTPRRRAAA